MQIMGEKNDKKDDGSRLDDVNKKAPQIQYNQNRERMGNALSG